MGIRINWNAVTAVCAIVVVLFTASGWLTDGLREDIRDLRQEMNQGFAEVRQEIKDVRVEIKDIRVEMREGFAEIREDIEVLQQDVAFIKGQTRSDQTTDGSSQRLDSGK